MQEYSLEELLYEYYDRAERSKAEAENSGEDTDKMEEARLKENLDWAEQEEKRELEELEKKRKAEEEINKQAEDGSMGSVEDLHGDWMKEQVEKEIQQGKELYGEDFGEDISEEF